MTKSPFLACYTNLDRATDRNEVFLAECRRVSIDLERLPAVDGLEIPKSEAEELGNQASGLYPVGIGHIGCYLSHRKFWEMVSDGQKPWGFICEDDVHFSGDTAKFLKSDEWLPDGFDLVKAETAFQRVIMSKQPVAQANGHAIRTLYSNHGGTAGYFVSKAGAERLLELTDGKCDSVDQLMFNPQLGIASKLAIAQIDPALCVQDYLLAKSKQHAGLESLIDKLPLEFHTKNPGAAKPVGFERRVIKPLRKTGDFLHRTFGNLLTSRRHKKVPIEVGGVTYTASGGRS